MQGSKLLALVAALAVVSAVAAGSARADHSAGPCAQDVPLLCPSVTPGPGSFRYCLGTLCPDLAPGPGGFVSCLQQYADKLSPACQQHLSELQTRMAAWKQAFEQACRGDVQTFCAEAGADHHAVFQCLRQHRDQLSQTCKDQLAEHHGHHRDHCGPPAAPLAQ
jgi:hypothetical protein